MKKFVAILFTVFLISAFVGAAALAAKHHELNDALEQGADHMLSLQGTYNGITNTWEGQIGTGSTGFNAQGISATGLVAAYEKTKDHRYLAGAIAAGNTLVQRYTTAVTGGATWDDRPYSQDIEFLAWLSRESKDRVYREVAAKWYSIIPANKTAAELVDRYLNVDQGNRASLGAWDLASQIRAALAVGQKDFAKAVAAEVIARSGSWVHVPYGGWDYTNLSYASLLWALDQVGDNKDVINEYRQALLAAQAPDGSWDGGDYQTTAYAVIGLSAVKGHGSKDALTAAGTFLVSSQTDAGGWAYSDDSGDEIEYGEIDSEVLVSLAALLEGGDITNIHKVNWPRSFKEKPKFKHMR